MPKKEKHKFPNKEEVVKKMREWYSGKPEFHNPSPADIVKVTYDIILEMFDNSK